MTNANKVSMFYTPKSLGERHKDNVLEAISLGFWSFNFGSSPTGKHLLNHWGKVRVFTGASRTAQAAHT